MAQTSSDPWLELLHTLRKKTGIEPIPLSAAEKESGLLAAFTAVVASPPPTVPSVPQYSPPMELESSQPFRPREPREVVLRRIRATVSEQMRAQAAKAAQPALQSLPEPVEPPSPRADAPAVHPKRHAMHLAAYKKITR
ncbi:MAG: hypothetical protein HQL90_14170 [Magnetococcales bacterium]|nr:hypothetical protein [Magnetococcales bacterium]